MKKIFTLIATIALMLTSCQDYFDINRDPNSPSQEQLSAGVILPGAEMQLATSYGDFLRITGGYFAQHYCQLFGTSNYVDYSQFKMSATRSGSNYTQLASRGLNNLKIVQEMAVKSEDWGTNLAVAVLRAFTYQLFVDAYGEIPYTESLNPAEFPSPKYDDGLTIYNGIINEIDDALSKVIGDEAVATNFLFPGARAQAWVEFANALKLKIYSRMSGVADVNDKIAAIIAANNLPTKDVAYDCYASSYEAGKSNPFYTEDFAPGQQKNLALNVALAKTMKESNDARLQAFFEPNVNNEYVGYLSGDNMSTNKNGIGANHYNRPKANPGDAVVMLSLSEIEFFKAEYYAESGNHPQAEVCYKAAIEASFKSAGLTAADAADVLVAYPYNASNWKECVGIQKWVALAGVNGFEAWCELRRLDYPQFGTVTGTDMYKGLNFNSSDLEPGKLYTPYTVFANVGDNKLLERWPYPETSSSRNPNTPAFPGETTPVFWAE